MIPRFPPSAPGMRIGLFGGSFNPAHRGHRHVSAVAMRELRLDAVWWLVTPGNPLKDNRGLPSLAGRIAGARAVAAHPRFVVTGIEEAIGTRYTAETIRFLTRRLGGVRFVWIMGADSLAGFDRWRDWREIARLVPIAVVARPGSTLRGPLAKAARILAGHRVPEIAARTLATRRRPAWVFLQAPLDPTSSTALRHVARQAGRAAH